MHNTLRTLTQTERSPTVCGASARVWCHNGIINSSCSCSNCCCANTNSTNVNYPSHPSGSNSCSSTYSTPNATTS